MPEVSEVRRYVDQLNSEFNGHTLNSVKIVGGRFAKELDLGGDFNLYGYLPATNINFKAKGKFIYWDMINPSGDHMYFFITLGMTGSFGKKNKHSAIEFNFDNGIIYFNDIRRFGTFKIASKEDLDKKLKSLGWDPLQTPSIPSDLINKLRKNNYKTIAEILLNQKIFAGVGNYIRSEALYRANLNPNRLVSSLTDDDIKSLCQHIIDIVQEAYACGGATIATYSDLYGNVGTFFNQFKVYGRKKDPLGNPVLKMTAADGRTVHYVESIQK